MYIFDFFIEKNVDEKQLKYKSIHPETFFYSVIIYHYLIFLILGIHSPIPSYENLRFRNTIKDLPKLYRIHNYIISCNLSMKFLLSCSDTETLTHLLKASLGSGILSMPYAFACAGLTTGLVATIVTAVVCTYCSYILVSIWSLQNCS